MEDVIGLLETSAQNLRTKIRRAVGYLTFHGLHIRHLKRGRSLAPVRTRAARSRYRTRRPGIPLHAMAGATNIPSHAAARRMGMKEECIVGSALVIRERQLTELGCWMETR